MRRIAAPIEAVNQEELDPKVANRFELLEKNVLNLERIIEDVVILDQIESGKIRMRGLKDMTTTLIILT